MKHPVLQVSLGYSNSASQVTLSTKVWNGTADNNDELASSNGKESMGGWGTQYRASSINRATEPASKCRPEYPVTPIRPAPWRRFLSRTAIDAACAASTLPEPAPET